MYQFVESKILYGVPGVEGELQKLEISEAAQDLVFKLLEKNPAKRLSSEQALKHHWFKILEEN